MASIAAVIYKIYFYLQVKSHLARNTILFLVVMFVFVVVMMPVLILIFVLVFIFLVLIFVFFLEDLAQREGTFVLALVVRCHLGGCAGDECGEEILTCLRCSKREIERDRALTSLSILSLGCGRLTALISHLFYAVDYHLYLNIAHELFGVRECHTLHQEQIETARQDLLANELDRR
jgi:Ca2+/Na+ antiporter